VVISSLALAACNSKGAPPSTYTIGGIVVNLAGTRGGLVLQDNLQDNLSVNANGSFTFAATVASGGSYSVTISLQPSNPAQMCSVINRSGIATADVTIVEVNCGHNEWTWAKGPNTVSSHGVYGSLGIAAMNNNPGGRQLPVTWTDASGNLWLFGGYGFDSAGTISSMNDLWKYIAGQWTWISGPKLINQNGAYGVQGMPAPGNFPGARSVMSRWVDANGNLCLFGGYGFAEGTEGDLSDLWMYMP
jgi:hypothetical protein